MIWSKSLLFELDVALVEVEDELDEAKLRKADAAWWSCINLFDLSKFWLKLVGEIEVDKGDVDEDEEDDDDEDSDDGDVVDEGMNWDDELTTAVATLAAARAAVITFEWCNGK